LQSWGTVINHIEKVAKSIGWMLKTGGKQNLKLRTMKQSRKDTTDIGSYRRKKDEALTASASSLHFLLCHKTTEISSLAGLPQAGILGT
jgi:hypothetical protein